MAGKWSVERRRSRSEHMKRKWQDPVFRAARCEASARASRTPEHRLKQSMVAKRMWRSSAHRRNHSKKIKQLWADPIWRAIKGRGLIAGLQSDEAHQKQAIAMLKKWADPEYKDRVVRKIIANLPPNTKWTSIEILVRDELRRRRLYFRAHVVVVGCCPDFVSKKYKIAIFCDGKYWHSLPVVKARDRWANKQLARAGWVVLRFTESEIKQDVKLVGYKVKKVLGELEGERLIKVSKKNGISKAIYN